MRSRIAVVVVLAGVIVPASASGAMHVSDRFFGISPQTELTGVDVAYMHAGEIGSVRWPVTWSAVQPEEDGSFRWSAFDAVVKVATRHRLSVLPFLSGTPSWVSPDFRTLPVANRKAREGWRRFVSAAVRRYGPGGGFWRQHPAVPQLPIRAWQVWNEANFFYFADPVSPRRYGRLLKQTSRAIKSVDPHARVILSGLFGSPHERRRRGMPAVDFLAALYRIRGVRSWFDGVALHPYAANTGKLKRLVRGMRGVARRHNDPRVPLYITEMGWGSQDDPAVVSFEKGIRGQAHELRRAYAFLLRNRLRLHIRAVYWFSWKDIQGACRFCDSVGLFHEGPGFRPKPAWRIFVAFTGGKLRPPFDAD